ncbi:Calycin [Trinorchestia longiramus]|nr:Calycin [Trinorchestia longiramus]
MGSAPQVEYSVVDTDYENYACTYTCFQIIAALRVELFFVTTREANPPVSVLNRCEQFFYDNYIETTKLSRVNQTSDVCSAEWRELNLLQTTNINATNFAPSEGEARGHSTAASHVTAGTSDESKLEDISIQEELEDQALIRNTVLESEKETEMIISLLKDDFNDGSDKELVSGGAGRLIPRGVWWLLVCFVFAFNIKSLTS